MLSARFCGWALSVSSDGWSLDLFWFGFCGISGPHYTQPCINPPKSFVEYRHLVFLWVICYTVIGRELVWPLAFIFQFYRFLPIWRFHANWPTLLRKHIRGKWCKLVWLIIELYDFHFYGVNRSLVVRQSI